MTALAVGHPEPSMPSTAGGQKTLLDTPDAPLPAQSFPRPKAPLQLLNALANIGARPLDDYLLDLEAKAHRHQDEKDALNRIKQAEEVAMLKAAQGKEGLDASRETAHGLSTNTPLCGSPSPSPSPSSSSSPEEMKRSRSSSEGLSLLAVNPSSRLGKKLCFTKTGHISELLQMEASRSATIAASSVGGSSTAKTIGGMYTTGHPVSRLTEFAQQAGLNPPVFTSVARSGVHCSPDHYVTLFFEGHTFVDEKGKRNVRSGRECVAQQALDFFLGTRDGDDKDDDDDDSKTKTKSATRERGSATQLQAATAGIGALSIDEAKTPSPPTASPAAAAIATTPPERECANPVGYLYETATRYNQPPPVFTYETKKGLNCSPDYFVQLTFSGYTFTDEKGQRSLKAGKDLVALRAYQWFEAAGDGLPVTPEGTGGASLGLGVGRTAWVRMRLGVV